MQFDKVIRVYECEDSIENILSAIYQAWDAKYGHEYIRLVVRGKDSYENICLFSEYHQVQTDHEQAEKVVNSVRRKLSLRVYEAMMRALYAEDARKADAVYHFLVLAFQMGDAVLYHLTDSYVQQVFELNRRVANEAHEYQGFLRFEELAGGILLAKFSPKNDLLEVLSPHFEDRFNGENFIIFDTARRKAAFHKAGLAFVLRAVSQDEMHYFEKKSSQEEKFQALWKCFFETIGIEERQNVVLQRSNLPLHYRRYMTEFH